MRKINKTLIAGMLSAGAVAVSGGAFAQTVQLSPEGPVWVQGYVSVNNTGAGGAFTDFNCKVKGHGRILPGNNGVILVEGVQALNHAAGQIPGGCHGVFMANLPWTMVVSGPGSQVGQLQHYSASISGVAFQAPPQPGCAGTIEGTWIEHEAPTVGSGTPALGDIQYPAYSRFVVEDAEMDNGCVISGLLKFTRPDAPRANP